MLCLIVGLKFVGELSIGTVFDIECDPEDVIKAHREAVSDQLTYCLMPRTEQ